MTKHELHEWTSPLVHTPGRAAFVAENHAHVAYLLREWEQYGPNNRAEAIDQLLGNIHDYRNSTYALRPDEDARRNLRRVRFAHFAPVGPDAPCTEASGWTAGMGWFHRWADTYEEFHAGPAQATMALVESDDGKIYFVVPEKLQFITPTTTLP